MNGMLDFIKQMLASQQGGGDMTQPGFRSGPGMMVDPQMPVGNAGTTQQPWSIPPAVSNGQGGYTPESLRARGLAMTGNKDFMHQFAMTLLPGMMMRPKSMPLMTKADMGGRLQELISSYNGSTNPMGSDPRDMTQINNLLSSLMRQRQGNNYSTPTDGPTQGGGFDLFQKLMSLNTAGQPNNSWGTPGGQW